VFTETVAFWSDEKTTTRSSPATIPVGSVIGCEVTLAVPVLLEDRASTTGKATAINPA
jgi:hypothetical protein